MTFVNIVSFKVLVFSKPMKHLLPAEWNPNDIDWFCVKMYPKLWIQECTILYIVFRSNWKTDCIQDPGTGYHIPPGKLHTFSAYIKSSSLIFISLFSHKWKTIIIICGMYSTVVQDNTNTIHSFENRTDSYADPAIYSTSILSQLITE